MITGFSKWCCLSALSRVFKSVKYVQIVGVMDGSNEFTPKAVYQDVSVRLFLTLMETLTLGVYDLLAIVILLLPMLLLLQELFVET